VPGYTTQYQKPIAKNNSPEEVVYFITQFEVQNLAMAFEIRRLH
jgi:hypothetical protein